MKKQLLIATFVIATTLFSLLYAEEKGGTDPYGNLCQSKCPNGYQDIFLFASATSFYSGDASDMFFLLEDDYRLESENFPIKKKILFESATDFKNMILRLNEECYRVKRLHISSHGDIGHIKGSDTDGIGIYNVEKLNGISCAFSEYAEVVMSGCNIADETHGEDFLEEFARRLFYLRGGMIIGATGYTIAFPGPFGTFTSRVTLGELIGTNGFGQLLGDDPSWKVLLMFPQAKQQFRNYTPMSLYKRYKIISEEIDKMEEIVSKSSNEDTLRTARVALNYLLPAKGIIDRFFKSIISPYDYLNIGEKLSVKERINIVKYYKTGLEYSKEGVDKFDDE